MRDSDYIWLIGRDSPLTMTVEEPEKPEPVVIYNSNGKPFTRPRITIGFDLRKKDAKNR